MSRDRAFKLRFDLSPEEHDRLLAAFFTPAAQDVEKSRHLAVYLDTPDAILRKEDVLWCFSRKDKMREGRVKPGEWRLDRDCGARSYVKKHRLYNSLGGVFTIRRDRALVLHKAGPLAVEISLEQAKLQSGNQAAALTQAQFILREGESEELLRLVEEILPQASPLPETTTYVERGYGLSGTGSSTPSEVPPKIAEPEIQVSALRDISCLRKDMRVTDAYKFIVRAEVHRGLAAPPSSDAPNLQQNRDAVRLVQSAFRFFAKAAANPANQDTHVLETHALGEWEVMLEKAHDLDVALATYLRPALHRGRWEAASALVARIEDSCGRAFAALAQTWPSARAAAVFSGILEKHEADSASFPAGNETFLAFLTDALAKATNDIETRGQMLVAAIKHGETSKSMADDFRRLRRDVLHLQDVNGFLEPLTSGKAARRWAELQEALVDLKALLDRDHHLHHAQTLVADAAAHIARLKQTKSQNAQIYAAGALAGFLEAKKAEDPAKALKKALANLSDVKPFWTKID